MSQLILWKGYLGLLGNTYSYVGAKDPFDDSSHHRLLDGE